MWQLRNETAFASGAIIAIDKHGNKSWAVVVKGTFDILPDGSLSSAAEQVPVLNQPKYRGAPGQTSLVYEQDLTGRKPRTDVYLNAHAYAPAGRPSTEVKVALRSPVLGEKVLVARGDRTWNRSMGGINASDPRPFTKTPIIYEHAFGGYDQHGPDVTKHRLLAENPVGTGFFVDESHRVGQRLPNIEWAGKPNSTAPAGFGALASYWQPRLQHQGTYDAAWLARKKPLLPDDYDDRALQCAPLDQQAKGHLRGGEPFTLVNMHPTRPLIEFTLPRKHFRMVTQIGSKKLDHDAVMQTVVIEPDLSRVIVAWHSLLRCDREVDYIDYTLVREKYMIPRGSN